MSEKVKTLQRDAFLNNSFDYDSMDTALNKTWKNSYSYLYTLQKSYIDYEELFYFSNDKDSRNSKLIGKLYLDKWLYANFDVDYDLIHAYSREEYRRSKFYNQPFTPIDIVENRKIFLKLPIVIIDDKVIWDYKMVLSKDTTTFILPFKRSFVIKDERHADTDDIVYVDHKIQVLVVDNKFYERITTNSYNIGFNALTKTLTVDKSLLSKDVSADGVMALSIHVPTIAGRGYELGTELIMCDETDTSYVAHLSDEVNNLLHKATRNYYISFVHINRLYKYTFYDGKSVTTPDRDDGNTKLLVLQKEEMKFFDTPIPVEDFMVFKKSHDSTKSILVKNTDILDMYYPNIYVNKDKDMHEGDEYTFYYFYYNAYDLHYTYLFEFYYTYLKNLFPNKTIDRIIDEIYRDKITYPDTFTESNITRFKEVFNKIMNYKYLDHRYGDIDFIKRYLIESGNEDKEPIEYKDETLREWIKTEPHVLRDYVLEQKKLSLAYHLFTNTLNLEERRRIDTSAEFGTSFITFEEEHYIFSIANNRPYPILLDISVYVDGIYVIDPYHERKLFTDYIYIPTRYVTEDSFIEIEVNPGYVYKSDDIVFDSLSDEKELGLILPKEEIIPTISDVFFTSSEDEEVRYDEDLFDISPHFTDRYDDIGYITAETTDPLKPVKFTRLLPNKFKIKPNSEVAVGKPLTMHFEKHSLQLRVLIQDSGYPYFRFNENNFMFNADYIRIYRNGRLVPKCKWQFNSTYSDPTLMLLEEYHDGEIIMIDISPYRYHEVYYQEELTNDPLITLTEDGTAILDLKGVINKPFDIRYYDVYLNGRKLSINNVFTINPWTITLVNIKSLYNLEIFEKERDWEYFGIDYKDNLYYYTIDQLFEEEFMSEDIKSKMIVDIINDAKDDRLNIYPNTNEEEKQDHTDYRKFVQFFIYYNNQLIPHQYYNPDKMQESHELIADEYSWIDKIYTKYPRDEATTKEEYIRKYRYRPVIDHNPDIIYGEGTGNFPWVYPIGHLEDGILEDKYINQTFVIDPDSDIAVEDSTADTVDTTEWENKHKEPTPEPPEPVDPDDPDPYDPSDDTSHDVGIVIKFRESGITSTNTRLVTIENNDNSKVVTIKRGGDYTLRGIITNTEIVVDKNIVDPITLHLYNLTIDNHILECDSNPIIYINEGTDVVNVDISGESRFVGPSVVKLGNAPARGVIYAKDSGATLTFNGDGKLTVIDTAKSTSNFGNNMPSDGIRSEGSIVFNSGTYSITANGNSINGVGIDGNDGVNITDGQFDLISFLSNGICSENGTINIVGGHISINYTFNNGISANNYSFNISGGIIDITNCYGNGIEAEFVNILGGIINIDTYYDYAGKNFYSVAGSPLYNKVEVDGNVTTEIVNAYTGSHKGIKGGTRLSTYSFKEVNDDSSYEKDSIYTVPSSGGIIITGGEISIDTTRTGAKFNNYTNIAGSYSSLTPCGTSTYIIGAPDDAISSGNTLEISGGTITINSSDSAIAAPKSIVIKDGADITINECYKGIVGGLIKVGIRNLDNDNTHIYIHSNDDGIYVTNNSIYYAYNDENKEKFVKTVTITDDEAKFYMYSGNLDIVIAGDVVHDTSLKYINKSNTTIKYTANGDGIHADGYVYDYGGAMVIYTYGNNTADSPVRTNDKFFIYSNATMFASGSDGNHQAAPSSSEQPYVSFAKVLTPETNISIKNDTSDLVISKLPLASRYQFYTSPVLINNKEYSLYSGGEVSGTTDHIHIYDSYSGGTKISTSKAKT